MSANLEQQILKKLQSLPAGKQEKVLALVESLLVRENGAKPESTRGSISEIFAELSSKDPSQRVE